jgi:xanthine dehydrogenase accessory factor
MSGSVSAGGSEGGFCEAEPARIRASAGRDLGGRAPEVNALSILVEMLAVRHGRRGQPFSAPGVPLHGRR